ncbi:MAG TPA: 16S rRNA (uracil(1498)-N(3))-methyltransferase [Burkholderiales bacterium]|nr:16S rRNA (uracil(1498)-N(3))-methyltransferase [Burkholderiales bacterium]
MGRAPRFYVEDRLRSGVSLALAEDAGHHAANVLRVRAGDPITLFDGSGGEYDARVTAIQKKKVTVDVLEHSPVERESPLHIVLVQGVSSGERMEFTIRKAVELGVAEIRPVLTASSVSRPKGERAASRQAHWQRVAISACEQCGRNRLPPVREIGPVPGGPFEEGVLKLLLSPSAPLPLSKALKKEQRIVVAAGPEAGFDEREEAAFLDAGFLPVTLGPRVLRTETAALAALAALSALAGDF